MPFARDDRGDPPACKALSWDRHVDEGRKMYEKATGFKAAGSDNGGYLTKALETYEMASSYARL